MSSSSARKVLLPSLLVVWAASCAVFPDEAVLPAQPEAGAAGQGVEPHAGADGEGGSGVAGLGGSSIGGSSGVGGEPAGGAPEPVAGGPSGGAPSCTEPRQISRASTGDTWIESAKPKMGHGNDMVLSVTAAGSDEQRALLAFSLPAAMAGATLIRATVTLHLEANADATLAERHLEVSQLEQLFQEGAANWENWGNGNRPWQALGGDLGPTLASAVIPASTGSGVVVFDVTSAVAASMSTELVPLPLIVREVGAPPTPPAELAFTSRQGDASRVPELLIEYCP